MSFSIVFETKIVLLSDGRILHLDRSGCNNDTAGRKREEFTGSVITVDEYVRRANSFMDSSKPYKEGGPFDLKIGGRNASSFDYGSHLLRMLQRAKPYAEFLSERQVSVSYCCAIELIEPESKIYSLAEFEEVYGRFQRDHTTFKYRRMMCQPNIHNEEEVVRLLDEGKPLEFYILQTSRSKRTRRHP